MAEVDLPAALAAQRASCAAAVGVAHGGGGGVAGEAPGVAGARADAPPWEWQGTQGRRAAGRRLF